MKKLLIVTLLSSLILLASCGKTEIRVEQPVVEPAIVEKPLPVEVVEDATELDLDEFLTDEELNAELEDIFNID